MAWAVAGLWIVVIYATIPFVRAIQKAVVAHVGTRDVFLYFVALSAAVAALAASAVMIRRNARQSWSRLLWVIGVGVVYVFCTFQLRASPVEALHFLEYGVLGALLFRALAMRVADPLVYLCALLLGVLVGTVDEIIQWLTPGRYWDWRDVRLNGFSCGLMLVAVAGGIRPAGVRLAVNPRSVRIACRFGFALLSVFMLCALNTPKRAVWCAEHVSGLQSLKGTDNAMSEYGHRHQDLEHGTFYSRYALSDLHREDRERGVAVAQILDAWKDHALYGAFFDVYPAHVDAFVHEARVHLFRRDHHFNKYRECLEDPERRAYHATIVVRENGLMTNHFAGTMSHSSYLYNPRLLRRVRMCVTGDEPYVSPVSKDLITRCSEQTLCAGLAAMMIGVVFVYRRFGPEDLSNSA